MDCMNYDDLAAALDYIEAAEHLGYNMSFERKEHELACLMFDQDIKAEAMETKHELI